MESSYAVTNQNQPTRFKPFFYDAQSILMLLSRSTQKFKNKQVLNMEFAQLVSNENQQTRFKTFSTLKMLYTGCFTKGAILVLYFFHLECEWPMTNQNSDWELRHFIGTATRLEPTIHSCVVSTYLYGAFDCMFLSSLRVLEWIYTL